MKHEWMVDPLIILEDNEISGTRSEEIHINSASTVQEKKLTKGSENIKNAWQWWHEQLDMSYKKEYWTGDHFKTEISKEIRKTGTEKDVFF